MTPLTRILSRLILILLAVSTSIVTFPLEAKRHRGNVAAAGHAEDLRIASDLSINLDHQKKEEIIEAYTPRYRKAIEDHHPITALLTDILLNVEYADCVFNDFTAPLETYRELARKLPSPYNAFAELMEGILLETVYQDDLEKFNDKNIDKSSITDNPMTWDANQFAIRLQQLMAHMFAKSGELASIPLTEIAPLVMLYSEDSHTHLTALDLLGWSCISLLDNIPPPAAPVFSRRKNTPPYDHGIITRTGILDLLIKYAKKRGTDGDRELLTYKLNKLNLLTDKDFSAYAHHLLQEYRYGSAEHCAVISALVSKQCYPRSTQKEVDDLYDMIYDLVDAAPPCRYKKQLEIQLQELTEPYLSYRVANQILPEQTATISYSIRNVQEFYMLLLPLGTTPRLNPIPQERLNGRKKRPYSVLQHVVATNPSPTAWEEGQIVIPSLAPGYYAIVPSETASLEGVFKNFNHKNIPIINVSNLNLTAQYDCKDKYGQQGGYIITITDLKTGKPVEGASVECGKDGYPYQYQTHAIKTSGETDEAGEYYCELNGFTCVVRHQESTLLTDIAGNGRFALAYELSEAGDRTYRTPKQSAGPCCKYVLTEEEIGISGYTTSTPDLSSCGVFRPFLYPNTFGFRLYYGPNIICMMPRSPVWSPTYTSLQPNHLIEAD